MINESKDVQTTPTRTYCKRSRLLPFCSDVSALKVYPVPAHHPSDVDLQCLPMTLLRVSRLEWVKINFSKHNDIQSTLVISIVVVAVLLF